MVLTGCNDKQPCPKIIYPTLEAVDKVPHITITIKNGMMDENSTKKTYNTIRALFISQNYYYNLVEQYRKEFL